MDFLPHIHLLHPRMVHFPIALFLSAMGLEVLSLIFKKERLHRTALDIYIFATVITPLVVLTGLQEAEHLHLSHPVLSAHKTFAFLTMGASLISLPILWLARKQSEPGYRAVFLIFLVIIMVLVILTGHNGGRMVYEYGVGVSQ